MSKSNPAPKFCEELRGEEPLYPEQARIIELEKKLAGIDGIIDSMSKRTRAVEKHCLQLSQQIFEIQQNNR